MSSNPRTPHLDGYTSVLLVDDHRLFRAALRVLVEGIPGLKVVGEASTGEQAIELMDRAPADLVIMDIHLLQMDGITASRQLLSVHPKAKILAVTSDPAATFVHEAMVAGVSGYVLKENTPEEFERAVQAVLAGKIYLCPEVSTAIMEKYRQRHTPQAQRSLSAREIELLRLIADGMRNKEIAEQLQVTVKSAETYRLRLMKKLGLDSTASITRYAVREGIVKA